MKTLYLASLILTVLATNGAFAGEISWVDGDGRSCDRACKENDTTAVSYGDNNGKKFYVCATNGNRQPGWNRPGFNLRPNWSKECWVENGGTAKDSDYVCLCHSAGE